MYLSKIQKFFMIIFYILFNIFYIFLNWHKFGGLAEMLSLLGLFDSELFRVDSDSYSFVWESKESKLLFLIPSQFPI